MSRKAIATSIIGVALLAIGLLFGYAFFGGQTQAQPAPVVVQASRPVSDVACGQTYQLDHLERFNILTYAKGSSKVTNSRVAVNFYFGGYDRNLQPQYIWDRNVIGMPTEIRSERRVDRSLEYSTVTFLCQYDEKLEGHEASNIKVMRYRLTLRRPLRPQWVIRNGGPARQ